MAVAGYKQIADEVRLPPRFEKKKWPRGTIVPVAKGGTCPIDGILFSEKRAAEVGKLRVEYDRLYDVAKATTASCLVGLNLCGQQVKTEATRADRAESRSMSWWSRYGAATMFVAGFVAGAAVAVGVLVSTAEIKK